MLLLRSKDQQHNKPLASFTTCFCRQRKGHEQPAISLLRGIRAENLALVQRQGHTGR